MDSPDRDEVTRTAYIVTTLVEADPEQVRDAFNEMVDAILERQFSDSSIVDWGTLEFMSASALDPETGREYIQMGMGVQVVVPES